MRKEGWLRSLGNPRLEESLGTAVIPVCPPVWDKWPANGIRSSPHSLSLLQHPRPYFFHRQNERNRGLSETSKVKRLLLHSVRWACCFLDATIVTLFPSIRRFSSVNYFILTSSASPSTAVCYTKQPVSELLHLSVNSVLQNISSYGKMVCV
jgi:hypothetical protein